MRYFQSRGIAVRLWLSFGLLLVLLVAMAAFSLVQIHRLQGRADLLQQAVISGIAAFGLLVAVPSLMFYRYFRGRVDEYTLQLEQAAERMVPHLMRFAVPANR